MIVFQESMILVENEDFNANSPLIGYKNKVTVDNIGSGSAAAGYPVTNLANPATHLLWIGTTVSGYDGVSVSGLTGKSDYFGIARHNFGSAGITVLMQGSLDGGTNWVTLGSVNPTTNDALMFYFTSDDWTDLRAVLSVGPTPARAAVVYCGEVLRVQRRLYVGHTPITMARRLTRTVGQSQSGNYLGMIIVGEDRKNSASFPHLTPGWYRDNFDPFVLACKKAPFFFAWRPADYPLEVGYCWFNVVPTPGNSMSNGMMAVDLDLGGIR